MIKVQQTFQDGLDLLSQDTQITDTHYQWLINGRNRFGYLYPTKKHISLTDMPAGNKQGIIGVGNLLIIFVAGKAFFQRDGMVGWQLVPGFNLDATVPRYWYKAVPASSMHFVRHASEDGVHAAVQFKNDFRVNGTPSCIVVQDGVNQPNIIIYDDVNQTFFARPAQTYAEWKNVFTISSDKREYVPIGKQMLFLNGILFISSPNNKETYRSISGRPLDFMVNIDVNGNKMPREIDGGAHTVSLAFDFDEITCLRETNIPDTFIWGTQRNVRLITLDYNNTIFSEPTARQAALLEVGICNQNCVAEILGDYAFIDFDGVKVFNAVQQLKFRGRNSNFSLMVSKLLHNVRQENPICYTFDNFCLFNVDTKYGNVLLTYDTIINKWTSFDITELSRIKDFAIVETLTQSKLYAVTYKDELFQLFASNETEAAIFKTKAFTAEQDIDGKKTSIEHKGNYFRAMFNGGTKAGKATLIEIVDDQESLANRETKQLDAVSGGVRYPVRTPVFPSNQQGVDNPTWSLTQGLTGKKISYVLIWDNDSQLVEFEVATTDMKSRASLNQKDKTLKKTYA